MVIRKFQVGRLPLQGSLRMQTASSLKDIDIRCREWEFRGNLDGVGWNMYVNYRGI